MSKAVQLNSLVAEAINPEELSSDLEFQVTRTKAATAQTREHWEGWLDDARSVRVKSYFPAGHPDTEMVFSIATDRRCDNQAPNGVKRSTDGKVNVTYLEADGILTLLYTPVNAPAIATVKLVRS